MRRRCAILSAAATTVIVATTGCGGNPGAKPERSSVALSTGAKIFQRACGACHTLTGHDTQVDGGDLGLLHGTVSEVADFSQIMPARHPLTAIEIRQVAEYVVGVERALVSQLVAPTQPR